MTTKQDVLVKSNKTDSVDTQGIDAEKVDVDILKMDLKDNANMADIVKTYLKEIGTIKLLKKEDEIRLAKKIKEDGCQKSKKILSISNLRLVVSIAKRYTGRGIL